MHENGICASGFFTSKLQHSMICIFFITIIMSGMKILDPLMVLFP